MWMWVLERNRTCNADRVERRDKMIKKRFIIELDETPALVFIQENGKFNPILYQDGVKVMGVRSIEINAGVGEATTHRVEYLTGHTKKDG